MTTITEISKKTLGSYVKKASKEATYQSWNHGFDTAQGDKVPRDKKDDRAKKIIKRKKGIEKAADKLTKEDVQPLIIAAASGSAVDFTNVFEELITNKIADLVEAKKEEIASTLLGSTTTKVPATDK